ncbi:MAG: CapA family protein [Faecousia sp.]
MSRKHSQAPRHTGTIVVLILMILAFIAGSAFMIKLSLDIVHKTPESRPTQGSTIQLPTTATPESEATEAPPETTLPVPEHVVATATIVSTGDVLMHKPVIDTGLSGGSYNFDSIFKYIAEDVTAADYAVANLEVTLAGTESGIPYQGYPRFNCPDAIVDSAKTAGFDMLLTANNHSYDTTLVGFKRTLEVVRGAGMETLGTYTSADETHWTIQEINGINIGMVCYTYATGVVDGRPRLNDNAAIAEAGLCNYFTYNNLDAFYAELDGYLEEMEEAGADATIVYLHWGNEYQLQANDVQKQMAQKVCDLGVDVLIGGHPHVVQPMDLLESTVDPEHKMVTLYSMGNAVSNQRQGKLDSISTAHTEDGVLFSVTFSKYSDGSVYLESTDLLPVWVYLRNDGTGNEYNMLPLHIDEADGWMEEFNMKEHTVQAAKNSHARTMAIVEEGLTKCQTWLQQQYEQREQYYYDLAFFPEKFATEAAQVPTETVAETTADAA